VRGFFFFFSFFSLLLLLSGVSSLATLGPSPQPLSRKRERGFQANIMPIQSAIKAGLSSPSISTVT